MPISLRSRVLSIEQRIHTFTNILAPGNSLSDIPSSIHGYSEIPSWSATLVYSDEHFTIYIGGIHDAINQNELKSRNISSILNCASAQSSFFLRSAPSYGSHISHLALPLEDRPGFSLLPFVSEAEKFLTGAREERRHVLVHCMQGLNRSVAMVVAFLVRTLGMSLDVAIETVARKRPHVLSNRGFVVQLVKLCEPVVLPETQTRTTVSSGFVVKDVVVRENV
jgi:hypothetical protein